MDINEKTLIYDRTKVSAEYSDQNKRRIKQEAVAAILDADGFIVVPLKKQDDGTSGQIISHLEAGMFPQAVLAFDHAMDKLIDGMKKVVNQIKEDIK